MARSEFLVRIEIELPGEMPAAEAEELRGRERKRGTELRDAGHLIRIWRVPGRRSNIGIWAAASVSELHELLASLPLFPWMSVEVQPLAAHPLEEADRRLSQ
ncbi:muconolactone Delta-isomerase family protein [Actinomadura sp. WMMA1423]|uniref:muconolactone Delta-isomerase family protein n=1 Tax=Actinomadura sp. WMMA1423 TaxID=2591108 RepID=UPI00197B0572|nr:muconolactone Delta-isomerase family protein [Actinomadura sp. WMMA1423]